MCSPLQEAGLPLLGAAGTLLKGVLFSPCSALGQVPVGRGRGWRKGFIYRAGGGAQPWE